MITKRCRPGVRLDHDTGSVTTLSAVLGSKLLVTTGVAGPVWNEGSRKMS